MEIPYADFQRIVARKSQYCRFLDAHEWSAFQEVVTRDFTGTFYDPDGNVFAEFGSSDELVEVSKPFLEGAPSSHMVSNPEMERISDTEMSVIWAMQDHVVGHPDGRQGFALLHGYGRYFETWIRRDGEWYLRKMDLRRIAVHVTPTTGQ